MPDLTPEERYRQSKAKFDAAYAAWKDGGRIGPPPPRPIPLHVPGFQVPPKEATDA